MTIINLRAVLTALGGTRPASGEVRFVRWDSRGPAVLIDGETVSFPADLVIPIVDGELAEPADIPATDGRFAWRVRIQVANPAIVMPPVYVAVPSSGPVDFEDLVRVDPATLEPSGDAVTAWLAAIAEVTALRDEVRERSITAHVSPLDPRCLRISYPAYLSPRPHAVRVPIGA